MHELGLTRNIVSIIEEHAKGQAVKRVAVSVGPLACVEKQALNFCFDIVKDGTVLQDAVLEFIEAEGDTFLIKEYELKELV